MFSRVRDRLKRLEDRIMPQGRVFVFFKDETSALGSDEQVEAFKAEKGVGPHDTLVEVTRLLVDPQRSSLVALGASPVQSQRPRLRGPPRVRRPARLADPLPAAAPRPHDYPVRQRRCYARRGVDRPASRHAGLHSRFHVPFRAAWKCSHAHATCDR
jgi:hypothetical protein